MRLLSYVALFRKQRLGLGGMHMGFNDKGASCQPQATRTNTRRMCRDARLIKTGAVTTRSNSLLLSVQHCDSHPNAPYLACI